MPRLSRRAFLASAGGATLLGLGHREVNTSTSEAGLANTLENELSGHRKPSPELDATDIHITDKSVSKSGVVSGVHIRTLFQLINKGKRGYRVEIAGHAEAESGHKLTDRKLTKTNIKPDDIAGTELQLTIPEEKYPSYSKIVVDWIRVRSRRKLLTTHSDRYYPNED